MEANCSRYSSLWAQEYRHWTWQTQWILNWDCCEPAKVNAGTLDIDSSVRLHGLSDSVDAFNIPILTLVDVPGSYRG